MVFFRLRLISTYIATRAKQRAKTAFMSRRAVSIECDFMSADVGNLYLQFVLLTYVILAKCAKRMTSVASLTIKRGGVIKDALLFRSCFCPLYLFVLFEWFTREKYKVGKPSRTYQMKKSDFYHDSNFHKHNCALWCFSPHFPCTMGLFYSF